MAGLSCGLLVAAAVICLKSAAATQTGWMDISTASGSSNREPGDYGGSGQGQYAQGLKLEGVRGIIDEELQRITTVYWNNNGDVSDTWVYNAAARVRVKMRDTYRRLNLEWAVVGCTDPPLPNSHNDLAGTRVGSSKGTYPENQCVCHDLTSIPQDVCVNSLGGGLWTETELSFSDFPITVYLFTIFRPSSEPDWATASRNSRRHYIDTFERAVVGWLAEPGRERRINLSFLAEVVTRYIQQAAELPAPRIVVAIPCSVYKIAAPDGEVMIAMAKKYGDGTNPNICFVILPPSLSGPAWN